MRRLLHHRAGVFIIELVVSLVMLGLITGGFWLTLSQTGEFNAIQFARQRCTAAAEAQLDHLAATGAPLPEADAKRLWGDVQCGLTRESGEGTWQGLTKVVATATTDVDGRAVKVKLLRYVEGTP